MPTIIHPVFAFGLTSSDKDTAYFAALLLVFYVVPVYILLLAIGWYLNRKEKIKLNRYLSITYVASVPVAIFLLLLMAVIGGDETYTTAGDFFLGIAGLSVAVGAAAAVLTIIDTALRIIGYDTRSLAVDSRVKRGAVLIGAIVALILSVVANNALGYGFSTDMDFRILGILVAASLIVAAISRYKTTEGTTGRVGIDPILTLALVTAIACALTTGWVLHDHKKTSSENDEIFYENQAEMDSGATDVTEYLGTTVEFYPNELFTADEKEELMRVLVMPYVDMIQEDRGLEGYNALLSLTITKRTDEEYNAQLDFAKSRYSIHEEKEEGYGDFAYGDNDVIEWWIPDCSPVLCEFSEDYKAKYPEIVNIYTTTHQPAE